MSVSGIDPVGPLPPGVKAPKTAAEHALYDACKNFESIFVQHVVTDMLASARGDDAATGAQGVYQDMADQTMTQSLVDSGSFGLAGTVYGQLVQTLDKKTASG
jgi:Rod binding domain-containing protein